MAADKHTTHPVSLIAIARAANASGDRRLERAARRELQEHYGIVLRFTRRPVRSVGQSA
jgi:hypothetical protein